jgi:hypothetical protein
LTWKGKRHHYHRVTQQFFPPCFPSQTISNRAGPVSSTTTLITPLTTYLLHQQNVDHWQLRILPTSQHTSQQTTFTSTILSIRKTTSYPPLPMFKLFLTHSFFERITWNVTLLWITQHKWWWCPRVSFT